MSDQPERDAGLAAVLRGPRAQEQHDEKEKDLSRGRTQANS